MLKLLAPLFSHSSVLMWFTAAGVRDGGEQCYSDESAAEGLSCVHA